MARTVPLRSLKGKLFYRESLERLNGGVKFKQLDIWKGELLSLVPVSLSTRQTSAGKAKSIQDVCEP